MFYNANTTPDASADIKGSATALPVHQYRLSKKCPNIKGWPCGLVAQVAE